jgi:hypothetical protein
MDDRFVWLLLLASPRVSQISFSCQMACKSHSMHFPQWTYPYELCNQILAILVPLAYSYYSDGLQAKLYSFVCSLSWQRGSSHCSKHFLTGTEWGWQKEQWWIRCRRTGRWCVCSTDSRGKVINFIIQIMGIRHTVHFISTSFANRKFSHGSLGTDKLS